MTGPPLTRLGTICMLLLLLGLTDDTGFARVGLPAVKYVKPHAKHAERYD